MSNLTFTNINGRQRQLIPGQLITIKMYEYNNTQTVEFFDVYPVDFYNLKCSSIWFIFSHKNDPYIEKIHFQI